jgi:hypothetical protein
VRAAADDGTAYDDAVDDDAADDDGRAAGPERPGPRRWRIDWRDDRGQIGGAEAVPFGVLVFVIGTLMVTNLWAVIDAKMAVNAAAREHVHSVVEAQTGPAGEASGQQAATEVIRAWGRDPARLTVEPVRYLDGNGQAVGGWRRCARVAVTLRYDQPLISLPLIGMMLGPDIPVRATRTELVDPFRSSAETVGVC